MNERLLHNSAPLFHETAALVYAMNGGIGHPFRDLGSLAIKLVATPIISYYLLRAYYRYKTPLVSAELTEDLLLTPPPGDSFEYTRSDVGPIPNATTVARPTGKVYPPGEPKAGDPIMADVETFPSGTPKAGETIRKVHPFTRWTFSASVVAQLKNEFPYLVTTRDRATFLSVHARAVELLRLRGLRETHIRDHVVKIVESVFLADEADLDAQEMVNSVTAIRQRTKAETERYVQYWWQYLLPVMISPPVGRPHKT